MKRIWVTLASAMLVAPIHSGAQTPGGSVVLSGRVGPARWLSGAFGDLGNGPAI